MVMTDPIADMFTRIRNAASVGKEEVVVPHSNFIEEIAKLLKSEGYIHEVRKFKQEKGVRHFIALKGLKVSHIKRLSKPGGQWYVPWKNIKDPDEGVGIISTSQGVMTHKEARKRKLGGELVGEIW